MTCFWIARKITANRTGRLCVSISALSKDGRFYCLIPAASTQVPLPPRRQTQGAAREQLSRCLDSQEAESNSKRAGLSALLKRADWSNSLFDAIAPKYRAAYAIALLTGARPAEIENGMSVRQCIAATE